MKFLPILAPAGPRSHRRRGPIAGATRLFFLLALASAVLALVLALAPSAFAAQAVELRANAAIHDGHVTLGDLFDNAGEEAAVVVADAGTGPTLVLDAGQLQVFAGRYGLEWSNPRGLRRVIARANAGASGGASLASAAAVSGERRSSVLVYARDLAAGEIVQPSDLVWSKTPAFDPPGNAPRDSRALIGQAARRALRGGAPASPADLSAPMVIKKDDIVAIAFQSGGIKLVLQAKAVTGAAAGESFAAINPASKKVIQALATGPGEGVVGPEADRIRAAMITDPQLFASLH